MTLLALAIECPRCGTKPNERIFPIQVDAHAHYLPDEPVKTWKCQQCGEVTVVTASAYQRATEPNGRAA